MFRRDVLLFSTLFLCAFIFVSVYTLSTNFHGDGFRHVLWAEYMAKSGNLITHDPYKIVDIRNGEKFFFLIPYPITSHVLMTILYLFGDELILKLLPSILASISVAYIFLIFRKTNVYIGFFSGLFVIMLNSKIFFGIFPSIEAFLLPILFSLLFYFLKFLERANYKHGILVGIFLGSLMSIKQQGEIFGVAFLAILAYYILLSFKKDYDYKLKLKILVILLLTVFIIVFVPLSQQLERNGTLGHPQGDPISEFMKKTPFRYLFMSKMQTYEQSFEIQRERIKYWPTGQSYLDIIECYLFFPMTYYSYRYPTQVISQSDQLSFLLISLIFIVFGFVYLYKKVKNLFLILIFFIFLDIFISKITNTPLRYHFFAISLIGIIYVAGLFSSYRLLKINSKIMVFLIFLITLMIVSAYIENIHLNYYKNSGRYDDDHLRAYHEMGEFIKKNLPKDCIILTASPGLAKESERYTIWFDGGSSSPELYYLLISRDINKTLFWLNYFDIGYIFIEKRQIGRKTGDGYPSKGIVNLLSDTRYFKNIKTITIDRNDAFMLYQVVK